MPAILTTMILAVALLVGGCSAPAEQVEGPPGELFPRISIPRGGLILDIGEAAFPEQEVDRNTLPYFEELFWARQVGLAYDEDLAARLGKEGDGLIHPERVYWLRFFDTGLEELPVEIGQLVNVKHLHLQGNDQLRSLPDEVCDLANLVSLTIDDSGSLAGLPDCMADIPALQKLEITDSNSQLGLLESARRLNQPDIFDLNLQEGGSEEVLVRKLSLAQMLKVKYLYLRDNDELRSLPEVVCDMSNLKILTISDRGSLAGLPDCMADLSALQSLYINDANSQVGLLESVGQLNQLVSFELYFHEVGSVEVLARKLALVSGFEHLRYYAIKSWGNQQKGCWSTSLERELNRLGTDVAAVKSELAYTPDCS